VLTIGTYCSLLVLVTITPRALRLQYLLLFSAIINTEYSSYKSKNSRAGLIHLGPLRPAYIASSCLVQASTRAE
jgi:hypothetical protein